MKPLRPIACGDTFRRLAAGFALRTHSGKLARFFESSVPNVTQFGVGVSNGRETAVFMCLTQLGLFPEFGALSLDFTNAFNTGDRRNAFAAVCKTAPALGMFLARVYKKGPKLVARFAGQTHVINSVAGVQQGDNLGPVAFAAHAHDIFRRVQELVMTEADQHPHLKGLRFALYLDDATVIGPWDLLATALNHIKLVAAAEGLSLNVTKSTFTVTGAASKEALCQYRTNLPADAIDPFEGLEPVDWTVEGQGAVWLGVPVGTDSFINNFFAKKVKQLESKVHKLIHEFVSTIGPSRNHVVQEAIVLLRCGPHQALSHLWRTVPPRLASIWAEKANLIVWRAVFILLDSFPLDHDDSGKPLAHGHPGYDFARVMGPGSIWRNRVSLPISKGGYGFCDLSRLCESSFCGMILDVFGQIRGFLDEGESSTSFWRKFQKTSVGKEYCLSVEPFVNRVTGTCSSEFTDLHTSDWGFKINNRDIFGLEVDPTIFIDKSDLPTFLGDLGDTAYKSNSRCDHFQEKLSNLEKKVAHRYYLYSEYMTAQGIDEQQRHRGRGSSSWLKIYVKRWIEAGCPSYSVNPALSVAARFNTKVAAPQMQNLLLSGAGAASGVLCEPVPAFREKLDYIAHLQDTSYSKGTRKNTSGSFLEWLPRGKRSVVLEADVFRFTCRRRFRLPVDGLSDRSKAPAVSKCAARSELRPDGGGGRSCSCFNDTYADHSIACGKGCKHRVKRHNMMRDRVEALLNNFLPSDIRSMVSIEKEVEVRTDRPNNGPPPDDPPDPGPRKRRMDVVVFDRRQGHFDLHLDFTVWAGVTSSDTAALQSRGSLTTERAEKAKFASWNPDLTGALQGQHFKFFPVVSNSYGDLGSSALAFARTFAKAMLSDVSYVNNQQVTVLNPVVFAQFWRAFKLEVGLAVAIGNFDRHLCSLGLARVVQPYALPFDQRFDDIGIGF